MCILRSQQRTLQMLILVVLFSLGVFVLMAKLWTSNSDLFLTSEHEDETVKHKNILQIGKKRNNTLNIFTKQLSTNDEKTLINLTDFAYKIKKENLYPNESLLLLVVVSSAPGHRLQRQVIRETWGQQDKDVTIVFMLGHSNNPNDTKTIQIEAKTYHDIVQGNFLDSYKNMTYKSTMSLKYAIYSYPKAKFLLKCDDDVLINMPLLKNFLKNDLMIIDGKNALFCMVNYARTPIRDPVGPLHKWYVSYEEWPEENFPIYCAGWYVLMTLDVALNIYRHAQNSTFFWIDDVFLTGIAARNVDGLKYVDISKLTLAYTDKDKVLNGDLGNVPFLVGSLNMPTDHIQKLWQYVLSKPVKESILDDFLKISHQN